MKVCIYGAGAIGGSIAVRLKKAAAEVSVIVRGAHLDAIRADGLRLMSSDGEHVAQMPATADSSELGPQDCVIVALKAHQAWAAAEAMRPLLGPHTAVVTAQNGLPWWYFHGLDQPLGHMRLESVDPGARQWNAIGPERAIGCVAYAAAEVVAPGVVKGANPGSSYVMGEPSGESTERLSALVELFDAAGLNPRVGPNIRDEIWLKLWGNLCFNPISALTHATLDVIATDPDTRAISRAMMSEAQAVAGPLGVTFPIGIAARIDRAASLVGHPTSMLQDLERGKPIELDALLGVVQEIARSLGVATPTVDTVLGLTRQMGRVAGVYPAFPRT